MQLLYLKIQGFKSFADEVRIDCRGQKIAVAGPNGCGKSNIMDAVRWVLGEARASELRGENMQDIIFNGSTQRKPAYKASVEMVFDNQSGRAKGEWGQFGEISIKRTLDRDQHSQYFINQQVVRRRDVYDLFMGTGLGPRAYAIIGQGMINRIIEARADDMRLFLEEAAGVSKYKDRRRETQSNLENAQANMLRITDMLQEWQAQVEKLAQQANQAKLYHQHQAEIYSAQYRLAEYERTVCQEQKSILEQEKAQTQHKISTLDASQVHTHDALIKTQQAYDAQQKNLETMRTQKEAARLHLAELAHQIQYQQQSQTHAAEQLQQIDAQMLDYQAQLSHLDETIFELEAQYEALLEQDELEEDDGTMDAAHAALEIAQTAAQAARQNYVQAQQQLKMLEEKIQWLQQNLHQLQNNTSSSTRKTFDEDNIVAKIQALQDQKTQLAVEQQRASTACTAYDAQLHALAQQQHDDEQKTLEKKRQALNIEHATYTAEYKHLAQQYAQLAAPVHAADFQALGFEVEPTWQKAVARILAHQMYAYAYRADQLPTLLDLHGFACWFIRDDVALSPISAAPLQWQGGVYMPLSHAIQTTHTALKQAMAQLLAHYYVSDDVRIQASQHTQLPNQAHLIDASGAYMNRWSYHPAIDLPPNAVYLQQALTQMQENIQRCAQNLQATDVQIQHLQTAQAQYQQQSIEVEEARKKAERNLNAQTAHMQTIAYEISLLEMQQTQSVQQAQHVAQQQNAWQQEMHALQKDVLDMSDHIQSLDGAHMTAQNACNHAQQHYQTEQKQHYARQAQQQTRAAQRAQTQDAIRRVQQQHQQLKQQLAQLTYKKTQLLQQQKIEQPSADLDALHQQKSVEFEQLQMQYTQSQALLMDAQHSLQALQKSLDDTQQALKPLYEAVHQLELQQQQALLNTGKYQQQWEEAQSQLEKHRYACTITAAINGEQRTFYKKHLQDHQKKMDELGQVNLAALEEFEQAQEKYQTLAQQHGDLEQAIAQLGEVIEDLDAQTHTMFQATFEKVNQSFSELFPELFGGGHAKLCLVSHDSSSHGQGHATHGVTITAQPPGKKNSTIHMLSGGEKALTAIALVFAIFQLNPAPFCLLDEVDAPLDDANTHRYAALLAKMSHLTQFLFISHNPIAMQIADQLIGVTMQEKGISKIVPVNMAQALAHIA